MRPALAAILASLSLSAGAAEIAVTATTDPAAPAADAAPSPAAVAQTRRRARLEREITALERELGGFPVDLDLAAAVRDRERVATGLEVWDITAERSDLRARIDHLRERIVLLEQIQQRQDDLDRARLVEHQRVLADVASERAVARLNEDEVVLEVQSAQRLLAARQAKAEMLARLRGQLDAIRGEADLAPSGQAPAAPAAAVQIVITPSKSTEAGPAPSSSTPAVTGDKTWGIYSDKPEKQVEPETPQTTAPVAAPAPVIVVPDQNATPEKP